MHVYCVSLSCVIFILGFPLFSLAIDYTLVICNLNSSWHDKIAIRGDSLIELNLLVSFNLEQKICMNFREDGLWRV